MTAQPLRFFLRSATSGPHRALEDIVGPIETVAAYRRYVAGMMCFRVPIEQALAAASWSSHFGAWRPLSLSGALAADAADLGLDPAPEETGMALSDDGAERIGLSYVLEGSSLGAQLTYRTVAGLGMSKDHGARHLALQAGGLDNWRRFVTLIESHPDLDREAAATAAGAAFTAAAAAFRRVDHG